MSDIKLIVALNNPGREYEDTRHNAGKWVVDALLKTYHANLKAEKKFFGEVGEITINGHRVRILCPTTFMNLSGKAVEPMLNFYNIKPEEMLVIHDEMALEPGTCRLKFAGGHAGHNGLKDIHRFAGEKYWRLRIGIGHPGDKAKVTGHVLGRPTATERTLNEQAVEKAVKGIEDIFKIGLEKTMTTFNQK
ncbi:aminoacyl-tRNA hydrolase [Psittacicella gerlachiana]|uniref:Peptidyl-tRNA hydrolase n=1 Tax=Psittacicella gerlachiana TaxID=2028574 RepID=A0A3A1YJP7_9GAMM|nr:aminoacyl-tRNA hydrolase [Psittacicella gerlachiana]RIY37801.1 aminoacyl-tRNA hydrolase [Psittacicella gerlachiana]